MDARKNEKIPASKRRTLRVSETATGIANESKKSKQTLRKLLHTKQRHADRTTNNKRKHMEWLRMYQTETPLEGIRPQHSGSHMSATNATHIRQTLNATNSKTPNARNTLLTRHLLLVVNYVKLHLTVLKLLILIEKYCGSAALI